MMNKTFRLAHVIDPEVHTFSLQYALFIKIMVDLVGSSGSEALYIKNEIFHRRRNRLGIRTEEVKLIKKILATL